MSQNRGALNVFMYMGLFTKYAHSEGSWGVEKTMAVCFSILLVKDFGYLKNEGWFKSPKFQRMSFNCEQYLF